LNAGTDVIDSMGSRPRRVIDPYSANPLSESGASSRASASCALRSQEPPRLEQRRVVSWQDGDAVVAKGAQALG